jgi:predicted  nucleic acid-binding Zn-ribbon protein
MSITTEETLDCQGCGMPLVRLSPQQTQQVAARPYNYIVWCPGCQRDERRRAR